MNNIILDNLQIVRTWIAPGASNAIIIDGYYKSNAIIAKLGFIAGEGASEIYNLYKSAFVYQLECEKEINEKLINEMENPYIVKMLTSGYINREYGEKYFKKELNELELKSRRIGKKYEKWFGYDYSKLVIMIFEKVENHISLYKFKGNLKDWLDILWNICQVLIIFNKYGLRHNDLNASNILIIKNIECTTLKIIDYGASSIQPTKLNKKLKIYNKSRKKSENQRNYISDKNNIIESLLEKKNIPLNILKILKKLQKLKNEKPIKTLKIIKNI